MHCNARDPWTKRVMKTTRESNERYHVFDSSIIYLTLCPNHWLNQPFWMFYVIPIKMIWQRRSSLTLTRAFFTWNTSLLWIHYLDTFSVLEKLSAYRLADLIALFFSLSILKIGKAFLLMLVFLACLWQFEWMAFLCETALIKTEVQSVLTERLNTSS